jgi:hypothetical protein
LVGLHNGFRNRISQKVRLRNEHTTQFDGDLVDDEMFRSVNPSIRDFLFIEFNNGKPSERLLYAFIKNPKVNQKVLTLYRAKQQRLMKIARFRQTKQNIIEEISSSFEESKIGREFFRAADFEESKDRP